MPKLYDLIVWWAKENICTWSDLDLNHTMPNVQFKWSIILKNHIKIAHSYLNLYFFIFCGLTQTYTYEWSVWTHMLTHTHGNILHKLQFENKSSLDIKKLIKLKITRFSNIPWNVMNFRFVKHLFFTKNLRLSRPFLTCSTCLMDYLMFAEF